LAEHLPSTLRVVSRCDPSLAPPSSAVLTVTLGAVPFRLFDSAWTLEKRFILRARALAAAEIAFPGIGERVLASDVVTPRDIDEALGATDGDLLGGELAGDQMLDADLWPDHRAPRTPITGFYLAGSYLAAGALATCAAGAAAARAVIVDHARGRLK
jgi:phytoene dehydrogenase-like protein